LSNTRHRQCNKYDIKDLVRFIQGWVLFGLQHEIIWLPAEISAVASTMLLETILL